MSRERKWAEGYCDKNSFKKKSSKNSETDDENVLCAFMWFLCVVDVPFLFMLTMIRRIAVRAIFLRCDKRLSSLKFIHRSDMRQDFFASRRSVIMLLITMEEFFFRGKINGSKTFLRINLLLSWNFLSLNLICGKFYDLSLFCQSLLKF